MRVIDLIIALEKVDQNQEVMLDVPTESDTMFKLLSIEDVNEVTIENSLGTGQMPVCLLTTYKLDDIDQDRGIDEIMN